jgi:hypothetical protein
VPTNPDFSDVFSELSAAGAEFAPAWERRVATTYGGVAIHVLSIEEHMTNKKAVGRPQDLLDLEHLERARRR